MNEQSDGPDLVCAVDAAIQKEFLDYRIAAYLRKKGWKHTSSTPGSIWLWEKKLDDDRTVLVDTKAAIHMQEYLEQ
jgi:hypothetical protein